MKEFWNQRYAEDGHAYGVEGNEFLSEELKKLSPGKILLPADGQGRNACMAAKLGWEVHAFDYSESGQKCALDLANECGVNIKFDCCSAEDFNAEAASFDAIALIYAHLPNRADFHKNMLKYLKPGGKIILEAFSKDQIGKPSGGPQKAEMLFSVAELKEDFASLSHLNVNAEFIELREGKYHVGEAAVVRAVGIK